MRGGSILGIELNDQYCQISFYDEAKHEPETLEVAVDNYQIPLILGYYKEQWVYGKEAKRLATINEGCTVSDLYQKALRQEKVRIGGKNHDAVWLLAKFFELALERFRQIEYLTFSVPRTMVFKTLMR